MISSWEVPTDLYIEDTVEKWDFCPTILKNESFISWFSRLSKENCSDARLLYQLLTKPTTLRKMNLKMLGERLNTLIIHPKKQNDLLLALQPYLNTQIQEFQNPPYAMKTTNNLLEFLNIPLKYPRFCPFCLTEDETAYFRDWWFFKPYMVCPNHKCILLDSCPHCNSPIQFWNITWDQTITCCSNCGNNISEDVIGIFELKDIDYYDILNSCFEEYHKVVKDADYLHFFRRLWELFLSDHTDPSVKMMKSNKTYLSSERLLRIITIGAKNLAKHPRKTMPIEMLDSIKTDRVTLRDLERNNGKLPKELDSEVVNKRLNAIAPLLKIQHRTFDDVKKQANRTGISESTLYNWMMCYRKGGIAGLVPKSYKSGRRSKPLPLDFEELLQHAVREFLIDGEMIKIKTLYERLHIKAQKAGILDEAFTYHQLCKRIRQEKNKNDLSF